MAIKLNISGCPPCCCDCEPGTEYYNAILIGEIAETASPSELPFVFATQTFDVAAILDTLIDLFPCVKFELGTDYLDNIFRVNDTDIGDPYTDKIEHGSPMIWTDITSLVVNGVNTVKLVDGGVVYGCHDIYLRVTCK